MNHIIRLREEAEQDLAATAVWYEQQRTGLGQEFLDEALATFNLIAEQPRAYVVVYRNLRRSLMPRFPFGVYFTVEESHVLVLAVIHGSRHPLRWQGRSR